MPLRPRGEDALLLVLEPDGVDCADAIAVDIYFEYVRDAYHHRPPPGPFRAPSAQNMTSLLMPPPSQILCEPAFGPLGFHKKSDRHGFRCIARTIEFGVRLSNAVLKCTTRSNAISYPANVLPLRSKSRVHSSNYTITSLSLTSRPHSMGDNED